MILDRIENAGLYGGLGERIAFALKALEDRGLLYREAGRYELRGEDVFAMPQTYQSRARREGKWEAHRKYIDVQYVVEGEEMMGAGNLRDMAVTVPYDEKKDVMFLEGEGSFVKVKAGMFAIFYPEDVHMPCLAVDGAATVRKVVVKVRIED